MCAGGGAGQSGRGRGRGGEGLWKKPPKAAVEPCNQVHLHLEFSLSAALRRNNPPQNNGRQIKCPGAGREAAQAGTLGEKGCIRKVSIGVAGWKQAAMTFVYFRSPVPGPLMAGLN